MAARGRRRRAAPRKAAARADPAEEKARPSEKITVTLPADLVRELRGACLDLPPRVAGSLSAVVSRSVEAELERLRAKHNDGKPFAPETSGTLPKGPRPRG